LVDAISDYAGTSLLSHPMLQQDGQRIREWLSIPENQDILEYILGIDPDTWWTIKHINP